MEQMIDRLCKRCNTRKPLTAEFFYRKASEVGGFHYECKECAKKADPRYNAEYYQGNSSRIMARISSRRKLIKAFISELKTECKRCHFTEKIALDFHHRDPQTKIGNVAHLPRCGWSLERIKTELAKCDIYCANCHMELDPAYSKIGDNPIRLMLDEHKAQAGCCKCHNQNPRVLMFHHPGRKKKTLCISKAALILGPRSIDRIMREVKICQVICANCHRIEHAPKAAV